MSVKHSASIQSQDARIALQELLKLNGSKMPDLKTPDPDILAVTSEGTLRIVDKDKDGLFDGVEELQVDRLGGSTSDAATVQDALKSICITNVSIGTPYDSLRRFASLYQYASKDGIPELPYQNDNWDRSHPFSAENTHVARLDQLEAIAKEFEAAKTIEGVTIDESALNEEGTKLYANLREEAAQFYATTLATVQCASSPEELRNTEILLNRARGDVAEYEQKSGKKPSDYTNTDEAYKRLATRAWLEFKSNAASDSKSARAYLAQYLEFCGKTPLLPKPSEKEIKRIWQAAAEENKQTKPQESPAEPTGVVNSDEMPEDGILIDLYSAPSL